MSDLGPGLAVLVLVGLSALVVGLWARQWKRSLNRSGPKLLSSVSLGPRERLVEVLHEGEILLLGVTSHHIALIRARSSGVMAGGGLQPPAGEGKGSEAGPVASPSVGSDLVRAEDREGDVGSRFRALPHDQPHIRCVAGLSHVVSLRTPVHSGAIRHLGFTGLLSLLIILAALWPGPGFAQNIPLFEAVPSKGGGTNYSVPVQTVILLTALSFLPAMLMLMTSFTRILIVLSLLRQAMGLVTTPPNAVLIGLALFITAAVMAPVTDKVYGDAWQPYVAGRINLDQAIDRGVEPVKAFMLRQTRAEDLNLFVRLSGKTYERPEDVPMTAVIPAFAISEIRTAFLIGFVIYLPFLAIDFAVASILTALGMVMVSPITFSLPLKLIVFVLADGWAMLVGGLVESFRMSG